MMEAVQHAPGKTVSRNQMKQATRTMKTTPTDRLPPSVRAMAGLLQDNGADMSRNGVKGGIRSSMDIVNDLPPDAMDDILATNDLSKVVEILRKREAGSSTAGPSASAQLAIEPKKRNNKDKNKNRKQ